MFFRKLSPVMVSGGDCKSLATGLLCSNRRVSTKFCKQINRQASVFGEDSSACFYKREYGEIGKLKALKMPRFGFPVRVRVLLPNI